MGKGLSYLSPQAGFLGLAPKDTVAPEKARAVIIPFGIEASVSYGGGTAQGPAAILKASHQVELFDEEHWCEPFRDFGIATIEPFAIPSPIEAAMDKLELVVGKVLEGDRFPLTLGGEHSLTPGAIRPFLARYPDLVLLHFDAHADLRDGFEGEKFSHAAAIRRCLDAPDLEVVSVGIRNISAEEIPFFEANRERIHIFWAKDRKNWRIDEIIAPLKGRPVYLTFDLDGFDASLMPATGTPEPGGLFWDDAMEIIRATAAVSTLVGADITELAPAPGLHSCDFLAAKLAYKILGYALT